MFHPTELMIHKSEQYNQDIVQYPEENMPIVTSYFALLHR